MRDESPSSPWPSLVIATASGAVSFWWLGPAVASLGAAMVIGWFVHLRTFHRTLPEPRRFLSVYLPAVAWQLIHFTEEFATDFHVQWPALVGQPAWTTTQFVAFNMVFYALFLVSAIAVLKRIRALCWFASFFIVAMILAGLGHIGLAIWVGGYFPGLATAPVSVMFGVMLMQRLRAS